MSKTDKDEALIAAIEAAEEESYGSGDYAPDSELAAQRAEAINAYMGKNTNPAPEGNSQVVSRDLFDTIEWITPSLVRIFAGSDDVVKFNPVGPEDEPQAKQETLYINHLVTKRNQWTQVFHDWCKDALLTKNAYCMAYYDKTKMVEYEEYENQSDDAFALLMQDDDFEVLEHSSEVDEDELQKQQEFFAQAMQQWQMMAQSQQGQWQQAAMQAQTQGQSPPPEPPMMPQPQMPPTPMLHSIKLRRTKEEGKVCLRVLAPERCVIHHNTSDYTLETCDFFEYLEEMTLSQIRQMGFDVPDDIATNDDSDYTQEGFARDVYNETWRNDSGRDPAMRRVMVRMCWIRHDYDEDGISELQYCIVVGKDVLYRTECSRIPVASIVATPIPHRHIGISIADVMLEIQDTKQAMLRQGIDNLFHANNPRLFVADGKINVDDALVSRPGGVVRSMQGVDAVFGRDIAPIVIPNIFPQAVQGMEYMDRLSERRTGVNGVFTGNVPAEVLTQTTGMAMNQMGTAAAQKVEQIARMMAPSVEYLFLCVHELVLKHGHKEEVVRLEGNWVTVDPRQWKKRSDLTIAVGLGSGNKDTVLAHLNQMFQMQMALLPMGVTDPKLIYNTVAEISKMAGFGSPDLFWKLPGPPQPQPPPPEIQKTQMMLQAEQQKFQAETQAEQQKFQAEAMQEKAKMAFDAQQAAEDRAADLEKARMDNATKLAIAELNANTQKETLEQSQGFEAQKIGATFAREDKAAQIPEREQLVENEAHMQELLANVQQALMALNDSISRPRVAVRDPKTGKALFGRAMTDEEMAQLKMQ
jgi:hypothetical protein